MLACEGSAEATHDNRRAASRLPRSKGTLARRARTYDARPNTVSGGHRTERRGVRPAASVWTGVRAGIRQRNRGSTQTAQPTTTSRSSRRCSRPRPQLRCRQRRRLRHARPSSRTGWPSARLPRWSSRSALSRFAERSASIAPQPPAAPVVGTTGRSTDATVASETRDKAPARDITLPAATPPAPQHALVVQLTSTRRCWVTASADGKRVIYRLLLPGTSETVTADREIQIMAGDAGALEWTINGRKAGLFGKSGQIVTQRITPESAAAIE